ncbi:MAG: N-acetylglucosamine-specific PTS transporter subunit IIBC [Cetobacterium sp.]|uniref:N-acetylglucosamine-specific PTS transporter subunit IIBC n=1 Tax=Cetobacterium sp. TaxID=2071632 RepID=UPI003F413F49
MRLLDGAQKIGKSLMLPIAVLPVAALLLRLGVLWNQPQITAAGDVIFANLPMLFAIGVATGIAKDNNGAAALAGAVGNYILVQVATSMNKDINMGVLSGIIAGLTAGFYYNKYNGIKLPDWLGFFGGRRFVPIVTAISSLVLGIAFGYIWPGIQSGIDGIGHWIIGAGVFGAFVFGVLNRILIAFGLHHILNSLVWFVFGEYAGKTGDLNRFFAGDPTAGMFMTGFFPVMMFGLPAAAFAMYLLAKPGRKRAIGGVLFSVAFTAFLTGITEPFEFMFMFIAPWLYFIHAILTGASMAITYALGIKHGFGFSAGLIDYLLNMGLATNGWLLIPVGLVFGIIYFLLFYFIIKKFNLQTPGREEESKEDSINDFIDSEDIVKNYAEALGGIDNLAIIDSCITRLRLEVKDSSIINEAKLKAIGAKGFIKLSPTAVQVIVGTAAESVANGLKQLRK